MNHELHHTRVLVVEDEVIVAEDLRQRLESWSYHVTGVAYDADAAVAAAGTQNPDVVLMDVGLKGSHDGIWAAQRIIHEHDIPIVFLTAYGDNATLERVQELGPFSYVLKPAHRVELLAALNAAVLRQRYAKGNTEGSGRSGDITGRSYDGIISTDEDLIITMFNDGAERIFDLDSAEVIGKPLSTVIIEDVRGIEESLHVRETLTGLQSDGSEFRVGVSVSRLLVDEETMYTVVVWDMSRRTQAIVELRESESRLRGLTQLLQTVREQEATRISREIHDELGQSLTAIKIEVANLRQFLPDTAAVRERVKTILESFDAAVDSVHRIAAELRPSILDDLGLQAAIEWLAEDFERRTAIECECELDFGVLEPRERQSTAIFRIVQESLTNVARHSAADHVCITMVNSEGWLEFEVSDNGRGIGAEAPTDSLSLGILGMRERAAACGGSIEIEARIPRGTALKGKFPVYMHGKEP